MANPASAIRAEVLARHPDAVLIERGLSHLRHQLPDLDGRHRFVLNAVIGALHYKDDKAEWQEIDDALEDDGADGFSVRTGATGHLLRMAADGKRRLYPNRYDLTRYVEFSALPSVGTPQRGENYLAWDRPHFAIKLFSCGTCVKFLFTLKDASAPTSISFNVALVGLTRSGRFLLADGVPVAEMRLPTAVDAAGTERDCTFTLSAGKVTIALDTTGLVFPIEIDPTVDVQVGASADDGETTPGYFNKSGTTLYLGYYAGAGYKTFHRWTGVTISGTITTSYINIYSTYATGTPLLKVRGVDEDNPAAPTTEVQFNADPLTTAGVDWDGAWTASQWNQSPSLNAIFTELVASYTISSDAVMLQVNNDSGGSGNYATVRAWDYSGNLHGAKLYIEYSTGVDATVLAVTAEATADAPLPTITTTRSPTISAVAAVATADALLPTISAVRNPTVSAVVATADADALIPTVEGTTGGVNATVLAVTAEAAAACPLPTVTAIRNPTVLAVTATATAGALLPTISTTRSPTVLAVAAEAIAAAPLPTITTVRSPTVLAVTAEATAAALLPTVAAIRNATVLALTAEAAATCLLPTITTVRSPTVLAVTATATAAALIPTITVGILYADWDIIVSIDPTLYPASATITFVAVIWTSDGGHGVYARLYNITDAEEVASSVVSTAEIAATELVSGPLSLPQASRAYRAEWGGVAGATYKMSSARILVTV